MIHHKDYKLRVLPTERVQSVAPETFFEILVNIFIADGDFLILAQFREVYLWALLLANYRSDLYDSLYIYFTVLEDFHKFVWVI